MRFHSLVSSIVDATDAAIGMNARRMYGRRVVANRENAYAIGNLIRSAGYNRGKVNWTQSKGGDRLLGDASAWGGPGLPARGMLNANPLRRPGVSAKRPI